MRHRLIGKPLPREYYETYFKNTWYNEWIESEWESIRSSEVQGGDFTLEEAENRSFSEFQMSYPDFDKLIVEGIKAEKKWRQITNDYDIPHLLDEDDVGEVWTSAFDGRNEAYDYLDKYWVNLWAEIEKIIDSEDNEEDNE